MVEFVRSVCRKTPVRQLKTGFVEVMQSLHSSSVGCLSGKVMMKRKTNWLWLQLGITKAAGVWKQKN